MEYDQARWTDDDQRYEPLLAEKGMARVAVADGDPAETTESDGRDPPLPSDLTRDSLELPDVAEPELARHYTRLSEMNYGVESGPFPLGSCTMKYNPSFTEAVAGLQGAAAHPDRPQAAAQGILELCYRLQDYLGRIGGMDAVSLQPPAGAAGEFAGILVARAYHRDNGERRREVVVPDSAHGTNFASAAMAGYEVVSLPSEDGRVDVDALAAAVGDDTAALMLTNPNTLGLFERDIEEIAGIVHDAGGLLYYDGANLNALLGRARPGDMGFDVMHYNVHKTFATPHGGGGPGAGPIGVTAELAPYLPRPHVEKVDVEATDVDEADVDEADVEEADVEATDVEETGVEVTDVESTEIEDADDGAYRYYDPAKSIGKVHGFYGNWPVLLRAYAYVARLGDAGLTDASAKAVLNANYLAARIEYDVPYRPFHHEFVASAGDQDAADVAKRMLDYGVHPPTTKWPEIVDEALMTEPTEAESRRTLDQLAAAFNAVADEDAATLAAAPERTAARRIDQVEAARDPTLSWQALSDDE